jgi:hypothetical protein
MKKYNNFLLERNDTQMITEEKVIELLKNCKHIDLDNPTIGRYCALLEDYYLIDPKKHDRRSANTQNYYTYIIDNSKDWEDFPKRSKSLICHGYAKIPPYYDQYIIKNNDDSWSANIVQLFDFLLSESLKGNDCRTALELLFNPDNNNILHMSYTDMQKHLQSVGTPTRWGVEVWTDSECLLIKSNLYDDLIKKFKK